MTPILILLPRPSKEILEALQWALRAAHNEFGAKSPEAEEWLDLVEKESQS